MAGRNRDASPGLFSNHPERNKRGGDGFRREKDMDAVTGDNFGSGSGKIFGGETAVVADVNPAVS